VNIRDGTFRVLAKSRAIAIDLDKDCKKFRRDHKHARLAKPNAVRF
jgi:hypothetical protein